MLLRPEHFEQMTARQELLLQHYASSAPFAWGISRLLVDEAALLQGRFTLLQLDARLPDGLTIHLAQNDDREQSLPPSIDLAALNVSFQQQSFLVYLAVIAGFVPAFISSRRSRASLPNTSVCRSQSSASETVYG